MSARFAPSPTPELFRAAEGIPSLPFTRFALKLHSLTRILPGHASENPTIGRLLRPHLEQMRRELNDASRRHSSPANSSVSFKSIDGTDLSPWDAISTRTGGNVERIRADWTMPLNIGSTASATTIAALLQARKLAQD
jgi:hypothetical protein